MSTMYELKISLCGAKPPIWRRVHVKPETTLKQLHVLIQILFGWQNSHLHKFEKIRGRYEYPEDPFDEDFGFEDNFGGLDEKKSINEFLKEPKDKIGYEYDFGDSWEHIILLENKVPKESNKTYPLCVTGRSMAPFDDCGGIGGFYELVDAIENADHPEHEEMKNWLDEVFGITDLSQRKFDKDALNRSITNNLEILA